MTAPVITQDILRRLLSYEAATGIFVWRERDGAKSWNTRYAHKRAGYVWRLPKGAEYWCIRIFDWPFLGHRLAWLYEKGEFPALEIDHIDCDGLNNRLDNLRLATSFQNNANRRGNKNSKLHLKGVTKVKNGKFRATIQTNRQWRQIGTYETAEAAHAAYLAAAKAAHGEFARGQ